MVAAVWLVEPAPVVGHEVVHAQPLGVPGMTQEREAASKHAAVLLGARRLEQPERHDRQASDIVDAVARWRGLGRRRRRAG